ncbi:MAG: helix-turn-helix domain-containing protein, partial [Endomicrobium sp.]|nr:helix-turn-helix domain-containing protein [Endomicrobium sp.]
MKITQEAYEVKRSTLYNWQKKYKDKGIEGLINGDRSPRRKRQSQIRREIKEYISEYRIKYGKIHQKEIKPHLDKYCKDLGIKTISVASIGRTIRELKEKWGLEREQRLRLNARSGNLT